MLKQCEALKLKKLLSVLGVLIFASTSLAATNVRGGNAAEGVLVIPFCGQGGASATNRFIGPAIALGEELVPGNTACDGKDAAAVGDADILPLGVDEAYIVRSMNCQLNSGTNDTVEMTLYDDTAATSATCTITAAGGIEGCMWAGAVSIAEGSLLAILVDNDDDDLSAQDLLCHLNVEILGN